MSKCLVTGGTGFIGKRLTEMLLTEGENVISIDLETFGSDFPKLEDVSLGDVDYVFHVGANANTLETDVNLMMRLNYEFTRNLSDLCRSLGIPLIYSSSAACYGTDGLRPANLYAWSKLMGEDIVRRNGGVSLRYFNVFGPGECHKGPMSSFMHQAWEANRDQKTVKLFPGNPRRDFIYVDDVCRANLIAAKNFKSLASGVFDVGTGIANSFESGLEKLGISWTYTSPTAIPGGYQFYTQASEKKFLPGWSPMAFSEALPVYKEYLVGNCVH